MSSLKMTMIRTVEDDIIVDPLETPEIIDDFELGQEEGVDIKDKEVNKQKLRSCANQYKACSRCEMKEVKSHFLALLWASILKKSHFPATLWASILKNSKMLLSSFFKEIGVF